MSLPPYGYEDESVIPKERVVQFIARLERECVLLERLLKRGEGRFESALRDDFWILRSSCDELGADYHVVGERLAFAYFGFFENPTEDNFHFMVKDMGELKGLLGMVVSGA